MSDVHPIDFRSPHVTARARTTFKIEPVHVLPTINSMVTVLGVLVGKKNDLVWNKMLIHFVYRFQLIIHLSLLVYGGAVLSLLCMTAPPIQIPLLSVAIVCGFVSSVLGSCVLSWHGICLIISRFEFWYLTLLNGIFVIMGILICPDTSRKLGFVVVGVACQVTFFMDASTYMRRYAVRTFTLGAPGLVFGVLGVKAGMTPNLNDVSISICGITINAVDVAANSAFGMALFMGFKALPSLHLIVRGGIVKSIQCEIYYPLCHLVPIAHASARMTSSIYSMRLIPITSDSIKSDLIDAQITFGPTFITNALRGLINSWIFSILGWTGLLASFGSCLWHVIDASSTSRLPYEQHLVAIVGLITTCVYCGICILYCQRTLLTLLLCQFDAWFLSFQWSMMIIAACDRLCWDTRMLFLWSAWFWCHWLLCLDTLRITTRITNGFFPFIVAVALVLYPLVFVYWIYFSNTPHITNNRMVHFMLGKNEILMRTSTFLASRTPSVCMWMISFLWRQCFRPVNALHFIKLPVVYDVVPITDQHTRVGPMPLDIIRDGPTVFDLVHAFHTHHPG